MVLPGNALSFTFMGKLLYRVLERAGWKWTQVKGGSSRFREEILKCFKTMEEKEL